MNDHVENKSQKISDRIEIIKNSIKSHNKNIKLLKAFAEGRSKATKNPRVVKYGCIPWCDKRYMWTLKNLTDQVTSLEYELAILTEYGL